MKQQVFKFCAHAQSHSSLLSRSVTEQNDNSDSGAKSVLCTAICEAYQLFLFSGHSGNNSTVIPHLPIALDAGISSFRQLGAFVKEKVQEGRMCHKEAWNE